MDVTRSTTWRSAVIGGCMILVPLCAIFGSAISKLFFPAPVRKPALAINKSGLPASQQRSDATLLGAALPSAATVPTTTPDTKANSPLPSEVNNTLPNTLAPPLPQTAPVQPTSPAMASPVPPRGSLVPSIPTRNPPVMVSQVEPLPPLPIIRPDPHVRLVSDTTPAVATTVPIQRVDLQASAPVPAPPATMIYGGNNGAQINQPARIDWYTHAQQRLRELGATYYVLETVGPKGDQYRFHCKMVLPNSPGFERHFEATEIDAARAMQNVLQQVEAWRLSVQ